MKRSKHRGRYGERLGLAERVVAERKRRGLRQADAAREIGISRGTLALVEVHHIASSATQAKINDWMAAPPAAEPRARPSTGAGSGGPGGRKTTPPGGPGLSVLTDLAVRRQAERAYRRAKAARAAVRKGQKNGKAR